VQTQLVVRGGESQVGPVSRRQQDRELKVDGDAVAREQVDEAGRVEVVVRGRVLVSDGSERVQGGLGKREHLRRRRERRALVGGMGVGGHLDETIFVFY
jgi:hypothetical protein